MFNLFGEEVAEPTTRACKSRQAKAQNVQLGMFQSGEDTALWSGTPGQAEAGEFNPARIVKTEGQTVEQAIEAAQPVYRGTPCKKCGSITYLYSGNGNCNECIHSSWDGKKWVAR